MTIGAAIAPLICRLVFAVIPLACAVAATPQEAAEAPMVFSGYALPPPANKIVTNAWFVFGNGVITEGTTERLDQFLAQHKVPADSFLFLNSPGGNVAEALKLGRLIRKAGLFTNIGVPGHGLFKSRPGACYSACTLAFLGGVWRFSTRGSVYGVHRFYFGGPSVGGVNAAQVISAKIVDYIHNMGVSTRLFRWMSAVGPHQVLDIPTEEQRRLNVVNDGEGPTTWTNKIVGPMLYLRGARDTARGINKFMLMCLMHRRIFLTAMFDAKGRNNLIVHDMPFHFLFLNGKVVALPDASVFVMPNDVVIFAASLPAVLLRRIARARMVGVGVMASPSAPIFFGFDDMPFDGGAAQLSGLLEVCRPHG